MSPARRHLALPLGVGLVALAGCSDVLKLILRGRSYDWEFLPIAGQSFRDPGTAQCVVP